MLLTVPVRSLPEKQIRVMIFSVNSGPERGKTGSAGKRMDYTHHYLSPLGGITMASDGEALTGLWFDGQKYFAATISDEAEERELSVFAETERWLDIYFSGKAPDFTPGLKMRATAFRRAVWEELLAVPYGRTMTYGELAERIAGQPGMKHPSARAVGGAVGHNAVSLIISCHRIVGADGSLTGYAGGISRKAWLLRMEGSLPHTAERTARISRKTDRTGLNDKEEPPWNFRN